LIVKDAPDTENFDKQGAHDNAKSNPENPLPKAAIVSVEWANKAENGQPAKQQTKLQVSSVKVRRCINVSRTIFFYRDEHKERKRQVFDNRAFSA
jgi:hypothetical protein